MVHNTIILIALLFGMVSNRQNANIFDEDYNFNTVDNIEDDIFNFNDPFAAILEDNPKAQNFRNEF